MTVGLGYAEKYADFSTHTFKTIDVMRIAQLAKVLPKEHFDRMLSLKVPKDIRDRFIQIVRPTIELATKYGVNPIWVLSVIWTESHFKHTARSGVGASGLMQVLPNTEKYVMDLYDLKKPLNASPTHNIEVGVLYLKYLLELFKGDIKAATVAYNMGPSFVFKRIKMGKPIAINNLYLNKVKVAYSRLVQ